MADERKRMGKDVPDVIIPVAPTLSEMDLPTPRSSSS